MKTSLPFIILVISIVSCNDGTNKDANISEVNETDNALTTAQSIAFKSGFNKFEQLDQIDFTFNVDRGESHFERSWQWMPKKDDVTYIMGKDTISYNRKSVDSTTAQYDSAFINDKYWLLAPFNLVWDEGSTFSNAVKAKAPLSGDEVNMLTITYGEEGGYTPGDAYDLYYGDDFMLQEWVFRKGNDSAPTMTTTWEDYKDYNGVKIATMHNDSLNDFKLYFTGIKVN